MEADRYARLLWFALLITRTCISRVVECTLFSLEKLKNSIEHGYSYIAICWLLSRYTHDDQCVCISITRHPLLGTIYIAKKFTLVAFVINWLSKLYLLVKRCHIYKAGLVTCNGMIWIKVHPIVKLYGFRHSLRLNLSLSSNLGKLYFNILSDSLYFPCYRQNVISSVTRFHTE